ncbi:MAG: exodeoxyribonuclease VII large subunit [candidate division Zixibacteria bacterium]
MQNIQEEIYSVSAVNKMARFTLEESFPSLWVEGEISNYHHHGSGHRYFSLKDDDSQLRCAMWRSSGAGLKFEPKDGLKVLAHGNLTIYERGGSYQLIVKRLLPAGMGELELAFRQLKEKLEKEGLFSPQYKKELPPFPMRIGVVTSPTGAVIHDICRVVRRHNPKLDIILWPSEVQGDIAAPQLAEGIQELNRYGRVDVILIGRGGGSLEDLWAFNDERVIRAVFDSEIPVISAIGHEVDITLTDLVADYSAATPSMAAEMIAWPLEGFSDRISHILRDMDSAVNTLYREQFRRFTDSITSRIFANPEIILESRYQQLDQQIRLLNLLSQSRFDTFRQSAAIQISRLEALSPLAVLARGYSVARTAPKKEVVKSVEDIPVKGIMETIVSDGSIFSKVEKKEKKN